ncbi:MAG: hypothetical protein DRQ97_08560 [Gammaproteobacteria bacterium]|nr:MAG: hypothetical protein DRQ97_08560 [Gammaproteobacteria bacterium]
MNILDLREALTDAILEDAGVKSFSDCHPRMHEALLETAIADSETGVYDMDRGTLRRLVETFGSTRSSMPNAAFTTGLSSSDFVNHLGDTLRIPVVQNLQAQTAHRAFCKMIGLPNFKPHEFPSIGIDVDLVEVTPELAEHKNIVAIADLPGLDARVWTFGRNVAISRKVIVNDQTSLIVNAFGALGTSAGRLEAKLVYELLESNPTLGDGGPMFHGDYGNLLSGAGLSLSAVGESMTALRRMQTNAGNEADIRARFLIVPAELEAEALSLVFNNNLLLEVVATSRISASGNWYVMSDPEAAPTVGLLHLEASDGGITVGNAANQGDMFEGVKLGVRYDVGVAALGRLGIVTRPVA